MYRVFLYLAFLVLCAAPPPFSDLGLARSFGFRSDPFAIRSDPFAIRSDSFAIRSDPFMVSQPESVVVSRPDPFVVSRPESLVVSRPEQFVVSRPEQFVVSRPEPLVVSRPEPLVVSRPESFMVSRPESFMFSRPESFMVSRPESVMVSREEPLVVSQPEPLVVSRPQPLVVSRPRPVVVSQPEPLVVSRPTTTVISQPTPVFSRPTTVISQPAPVYPQTTTTVFSQQNPTIGFQAQDDLDVVDSLGAGYSFFKKQPIASRPVFQQRLAALEQPTPFPSLDDSSHQWSDYTQASAFQQTPLPTPLPAREDVVVNGGYGQPAMTRVRAFPTAFSTPQEEISVRVNVMPKTIIRQEEGPYGSALGTAPEALETIEGPQPSLPIAQPLPTPQSITRTVGSPYGQQIVERFASPVVRRVATGFPHEHRLIERTLLRVRENDVYDVPAPPVVKEIVPEVGYSQRVVERIAPPVVRTVSTGYGQPVVERIASPVVRTVSTGFTQLQPELADVQVATPALSATPIGIQQATRFMPMSRFASGFPSAAMRMSETGLPDGW